MDAELKRAAIGIGKFILVLFLLVVALNLWIDYSARVATRDARELCDGTKIGDDISTVIARYKHPDAVTHMNNGHYSFFFSVTGFDKAVCYVDYDQNNKVVAKEWQMQWD
jgi:hypothetical protein